MSLNRTKIDWADYSVNPVKGLCKNTCWYCYAKAMYKRLKWHPGIIADWECMDEIATIKKPSKIFVGSMHDLFGYWIPDVWILNIIEYCKKFPKHTFIFLTKYPARYKDFEFPKNCWLGITLTGEEDFDKLKEAMWSFIALIYKNIKFISFEPLLKPSILANQFISAVHWIIIGGLTPKPVHKKEWVYDIIANSRFWKVPIFIKDNLGWPDKIREFPWV